MPDGDIYFECCDHCPEDCGAKDRHRFNCNKCQPRIKAEPEGLPNVVSNSVASGD